MAIQAGMSAAQTPVEIPRALAAAWQAMNLYGSQHPSLTARLKELCAATQSLRAPMRVLIEPARMLADGKALEPADLYAPFAAVLHRHSIAALDVFGPIDPASAAAMLNAILDRKSGADHETDLASHIKTLTKGRVQAHYFAAQSVHLRAGSASDEQSSGFAAIAVASATGKQWRGSPQALPAGGPSPSAAQLNIEPSPIPEELAGPWQQFSNPMTPPDARRAAVAAFQDAVAKLPADRRQRLMQSLADESAVKFDDAVEMLSLAPIDDLARCIEVLQREDSRLSETSLMLLKRLSHLAVGSRTEMGKLTSVADGWTSGQAQDDAAYEIASTMSTLLKQLMNTETRSAEYWALLQELSNRSGDGASGAIVTRVTDEVALISPRAADCTCEMLRMGIGDVEDRCNMLRYLTNAGRTLAGLGLLDPVLSILGVADESDRGTKSFEERSAAQALLAVASEENWISQVLGTCTDESVIRRTLETRGLSPLAAADVLLRARCCARTPAQRQTLGRMLEQSDAGVVRDALEQAVMRDARIAAANSELFLEHFEDEHLRLLRPALVGDDSTQRRTAYALLNELHLEWPHELRIRGLLDADDVVRVLTISRLATETQSDANLMIDRIAGYLGGPPVAQRELDLLSACLDADERPQVTRRLARRLIRTAWSPRRARQARDLMHCLSHRQDTVLARLAQLLFRIPRPRTWSRNS